MDRPRRKPHRWFERVGLLFLPVAWPGWAATVATLVFCGWSFVAVDARSHSASDTLIGVYPFAAPALIALYVLAMQTSGSD